jgi:hypothetical protein
MANAKFILKFFERLLDERTELQRKIKTLNFFIKVAPNYKELNDFQKSALVEQLEVMKKYLDILNVRIENIEEEYNINNND